MSVNCLLAERSIWLKKISIKHYKDFDRGKYINKFRSLIEFTSKQINKKNIDNQKIKSFIIDRYKVLLREKNIKYDVINCLVNNDNTFLSKINERLTILNDFLDTKKVMNLNYFGKEYQIFSI